MAYEHRRPIFNLSGTLTVGCSALDTSLQSTIFPNLPSDYSTTLYLPLTVANDAQGKAEIVWVTGHSAAASTATVVRGREGTSAQAFSAGDVVRCSPTIRDVVGGVANRAALPTDAHIGQRVLIIAEAQVVEYTSAGWNDSAPLEADVARKHHWVQTGAPTGAGTIILISGLSSTQVGTSGTIATQTGGNLTLNKAGLWSITAAIFATSGTSRNQGVQLKWTNGAFPGGSTLYQINGAIGGSGILGNGLSTMSWVGYVNEAQAALPIEFSVFTSIAITGCQYDLYAEYLGA
jgi:hypothetical protein